MVDLKILSAGAGQSLIETLAPMFETATGVKVESTFGPAGAVLEKVRNGEIADIVLVTPEAISELTEKGLLKAGFRETIGTVNASIAVRKGDPLPSIADTEALRAAVLAADEIFLPNPERATAGAHFARVLERLDIREQVSARLRPQPNGAAAMRALAASTARTAIGCTQDTEILHTPGVRIVGALPAGLELKTAYAATISAKAPNPEAAEAFFSFLSEDRAVNLRAEMGFMPA